MLIDIELPKELMALRDIVRRFVAEYMPLEAAEEWDKQDYFPRDVYQKLAELGVAGLTVPEEYGGTGSNIVGMTMVIEELSKRSLAIAGPYIMNACYAGITLSECGTEKQKAALLPRVADGRLLFSYGWTEPDVGADLASVTTSAQWEGDEIVVNGAKRFCTGASECDFIYALVRSGPVENRYRNLSCVLIPPGTDGVEIERIDALGMRGASTTDVTFHDVRVTPDNIMGEESGWNNGWKLITGTGLDIEKQEVAAMALGVATGAYEEAWQYARERRQFGKPISEHQSVRHKLADMQTALHAARVLLYHTATLLEEHRTTGVETSMTKLFVTETARDVTLEAQNILGAYGYVKGFACERLLRDVVIMPIFGGSSAIQRNNIAKWSGLDA
jgi:alkylation response protein AidB-like acyl-CoA dehydrogenase